VGSDSGAAISFILSYLSLAGILSIGEALNRIFRGRIPDPVLLPLTASIGAFLATAAVSAFYFGSLRPIGIIAGLIIVPLTTVFMTGALAALVLDLIFPFLAHLLGAALDLLYRVMEKIVSFSGSVPGFTAAPLLTLAVSAALAVFILWFSAWYGEKKRRLLSFAS
jgi:competence protein ComEC